MEQFADEFEREAAQLRHNIKKLECELEETKTLKDLYESDLKNAEKHINIITEERDILYQTVRLYGSRKSWKYNDGMLTTFTVDPNGMGPAFDAIDKVNPVTHYNGSINLPKYDNMLTNIKYIDGLVDRALTEGQDNAYKYLEEIKHKTFTIIHNRK